MNRPKMKRNMMIAVGAVLLAMLGLAATKQMAEPGASDGVKGTPAPAWSLKDVNGKTVQLSDFKGKVVILDFWATWCPPCRMEIPGLVKLQKKYGDQGLAVVGVSLDRGGTAVVKKGMRQLGINYPVVMGDQKTQLAYGGVEAIPTTFVIDRQGKIVAKHVGYTDQSEFESEIKPLLKQKGPDTK